MGRWRKDAYIASCAETEEMAMIKKNGFTLIELLIVVTLSGMLILAAVSLFFTSLVGNEKTSSALSVKQNGDYAISQIGRLIRNSRTATCVPASPPSTQLTLIGNDGGTTTLGAVAVGSRYQIASTSAALTGYLTGYDVNIPSGSVSFTCTNPTDGSPAYVSVSFTLTKGVVGDRDYVSLPFKTSVGLRTY